MIHVYDKELPQIAAWLGLGHWTFPRVKEGLVAEHENRPFPLEIIPHDGGFATEDRNRFLLEAFRRRNLTAWAWYWGITLCLNPDQPMPGMPGTEWKAIISKSSRCWEHFCNENPLILVHDVWSICRDSPEAVAMQVANDCNPELPNWEKWLDKPEKLQGAPEYVSHGTANGWKNGKHEKVEACPHRIRHFNVGTERSARGFNTYYCPVCRFYYDVDSSG